MQMTENLPLRHTHASNNEATFENADRGELE